MKKGFNEKKIEKDIEAFSIFSIYKTNFNDKDDIMNHIDEILDLYKDYNSVMFFNDPYFEEISKRYINGDNNFDTYWYEQLIKYCTRKLKVDKYDPNSLFCRKLYEYYEIVISNKTVDNKTYNLIVNTYIYFAEFIKMEDYILRKLLNKNNIMYRSTYINFIKKLGNKFYNRELKKYNKQGRVTFSAINDKYYKKTQIGLYKHIDNRIILSVQYLSPQKIIFNLKTLFHEINHAKQYNNQDYYDYEKNQSMKEIFLKYILETSYNKNYLVFKHEYDAEYRSSIDTAVFIKSYTSIKRYLGSILDLLDYEQDDLRIYDNEKIHIDQLFDREIKKNLTVFKENHAAFNLEYDENGNRYLVSHFIIQKNLTDDKKIIKFYNDLIYKHCYSYKELLLNIKDLLNMISQDKEHAHEYRRVLYNLINEKFTMQTSNEFKNLCYKIKLKIKNNQSK